MKTNISMAEVVDQLGGIKAQIAELEKTEAQLVGILKAAGPGRVEGILFEANTFETERENVAWKAIAEKVGYTHQLKSANTSRSTTVTTKVQARTGLQVAA